MSCLKALLVFSPLLRTGERGSWESDLNEVNALVRLEWILRDGKMGGLGGFVDPTKRVEVKD